MNHRSDGKPVIPVWLAACCVVCVGLMFGLAGCSSYNDARGKGDAPAAPGDDSSAAITNMPDGFPNLAVKCLKGDAPWAAAVSTDRTIILIQDPARCGGKPVVSSQAAEGN